MTSLSPGGKSMSWSSASLRIPCHLLHWLSLYFCGHYSSLFLTESPGSSGSDRYCDAVWDLAGHLTNVQDREMPHENFVYLTVYIRRLGGKKVGKTKMSQITYGLQLGGQVYSQMIFFRDERVLDDFTSGIFEFGAQARSRPSQLTG